MRRLGLIGVLVFAGCSAAPAATPVVIYVTPPPATVAAVTPSPTVEPTAKATPTAGTHDVTVNVTLFGSYGHEISMFDGKCYGIGGYDDIAAGMQATIHDATGTVIGFGTFANDGVPDDKAYPHECTLSTMVRHVPDSSIYGVEVSRRGEVQFSREELSSQYWNALLSIGS